MNKIIYSIISLWALIGPLSAHISHSINNEDLATESWEESAEYPKFPKKPAPSFDWSQLVQQSQVEQSDDMAMAASLFGKQNYYYRNDQNNKVRLYKRRELQKNSTDMKSADVKDFKQVKQIESKNEAQAKKAEVDQAQAELQIEKITKDIEKDAALQKPNDTNLTNSSVRGNNSLDFQNGTQTRKGLSKSRLASVERLFNMIDKDGDGQITPKDIDEVFDLSKMSKQKQIAFGNKTRKEILVEAVNNLTGPLGNGDGIATKKEFMSYYSIISDAIKSDEQFDFLIKTMAMAFQPPQKNSMSDYRQQLVKRLFSLVDKDFNGNITTDEVKSIAKVHENPDYISGRKTKEEVLKEYVNNMTGPSGNDDGVATWDEIKEYFSYFSMSIDDDKQFEAVIKQLAQEYLDAEKSNDNPDIKKAEFSDYRQQLVAKLFNMYDKDGNGLITREELLSTYDYENSPEYKSGRKTKAQVFEEMFERFYQLAGSDKMVSFDEFKTEQKKYSDTYADDKDFAQFIKLQEQETKQDGKTEDKEDDENKPEDNKDDAKPSEDKQDDSKPTEKHKMSKYRLNKVMELFKRIDQDRNGVITATDIENAIKYNMYPGIKNGTIKKEDILQQYLQIYLDVIGKNDSVTSQKDFKEYYRQISQYYKNDKKFGELIDVTKKEFKLPKNGGRDGNNTDGRDTADGNNSTDGTYNNSTYGTNNSTDGNQNDTYIMPEIRFKKVVQFFDLLDVDKNGNITLSDVEQAINYNMFPEYKTGELSKKQIINLFMDQFGNVVGKNDSVITWPEMYEYYTDVSKLYKSDKMFGQLIDAYMKEFKQPKKEDKDAGTDFDGNNTTDGNQTIGNNTTDGDSTDGDSNSDDNSTDDDSNTDGADNSTDDDTPFDDGSSDECQAGCKTCWTNSGQNFCYQCRDGWFQKRKFKYRKCHHCKDLEHRMQMEHCEQCNEFECTRCKKGYFRLLGGCFKCYFDWQCKLDDRKEGARPIPGVNNLPGRRPKMPQQYNKSIELMNPKRYFEYNRKSKEVANLLSNVGHACMKNPCSLNKFNEYRVETFSHLYDNDLAWQFWQVYQFPNENQSYSINLTWTSGRDNYATKNSTQYMINLIENASKPKLHFTGYETADPILLMFEDRSGGNSTIRINVYDNQYKMTQGIYSDQLHLAEYLTSFEDLQLTNIGSPSFSEVQWTGNIHHSKIVITFEFQTKNDSTIQIAKGVYRNFIDGQGNFNPSWRVYRMPHLNEIYINSGYLDTFGSRHKFTYQDTDYFLVETSKINNRTKKAENVILLADEGLIPLIELPIQLPGSLRRMSNFSAPSIREISTNREMATLVVSFQHRTPGDRQGDWNEAYPFGHGSSFIYFVEVGLSDLRDKKVVVNDKYAARTPSQTTARKQVESILEKIIGVFVRKLK